MDQQAEIKSAIPPEKPLGLIYLESKNRLAFEINELIKEYQIPFWLLEIIISQLYDEVKGYADTEIEHTKAAYHMELEKWELENAPTNEENVEAE